MSSATVIQDKKDKNSKDKTNTSDDTDTTTISSDNALVPATGPAGVSDGSDDEDVSPDQISVYVVREDDSIAKIADMFGVTPNTIRWANDLKVGEPLKAGSVLIILPVSGLQIKIVKGDTIAKIAKKYKVDASDIASFNGIAEDSDLAIGDNLIIPDGTLADDGGGKPTTKTSSKAKDYYIKHPLQNLGGYFINPVPDYVRRSQGIHANNGVDLAAPTGTPIVAPASGLVIFARNGNNGGYGNMIMINHPNGTQTLYGHLSKIATSVGSQVSQGEIIGYVGSTGHSTGPHLHFEVHGARNPTVDLPKR